MGQEVCVQEERERYWRTKNDFVFFLIIFKLVINTVETGKKKKRFMVILGYVESFRTSWEMRYERPCLEQKCLQSYFLVSYTCQY